VQASGSVTANAEIERWRIRAENLAARLFQSTVYQTIPVDILPERSTL
jgi:hypothetical protein